MKKNYVKPIFEGNEYKNIIQYDLVKQIDTKIKPKNVFQNYNESKKNEKKKLSKAQLTKLQKHSEHHSTKHMNLMKKLMLQGNNFSKAHKAAMDKVGK